MISILSKIIVLQSFSLEFLNLIFTHLLDMIPFESFVLVLSETLKSKVAISS